MQSFESLWKAPEALSKTFNLFFVVTGVYWYISSQLALNLFRHGEEPLTNTETDMKTVALGLLLGAFAVSSVTCTRKQAKEPAGFNITCSIAVTVNLPDAGQHSIIHIMPRQVMLILN